MCVSISVIISGIEYNPPAPAHGGGSAVLSIEISGTSPGSERIMSQSFAGASQPAIIEGSLTVADKPIILASRQYLRMLEIARNN